MTSKVGLWILAVAAVSFLAGLVIGFALPTLTTPAAAAEGPEAYARTLARNYGLSDEQHERLLMVLRAGEQRELEILKGANWSQLPASLRGARLEANRKTEQRIRFVLDEEQRALYDRDSRPAGAALQGASETKNR